MPNARMQQVPSLTIEVGERLRSFRRGLDLTLSELAQRASVSVSNLSKIERGDVSPSFDVIMRLCEAIGIPIEQFVKPGPKGQVYGRKTVTQRGDAVPFASKQYDYLAHSSEISRKTMVPLEMWIRARSPDEFDHWSQHDGEEYVYVIAGEIDVYTDHYAPFRVRTGESAYFDSSMKHIYVSVGDGDAHVLSVSCSLQSVERSGVDGFLNPAARSGDLVSRTAPDAAQRETAKAAPSGRKAKPVTRSAT